MSALGLVASQIPDPGPVLRYDVLGLLFLVLIGAGMGLREAWRTVRDFLALVSERVKRAADVFEAALARLESALAAHDAGEALRVEQLHAQLQADVRAIVMEAVQPVMRELRIVRIELRQARGEDVSEESQAILESGQHPAPTGRR